VVVAMSMELTTFLKQPLAQIVESIDTARRDGVGAMITR
jgi:hypothetical protein